MTELNPRATPVDGPVDGPGGVDSIGMSAAVDALGEQMEAALASAADVGGLPDASGVTSVVVMGMGGSGVAGDIVAALAVPQLAVPVAVVKGYDCPAFVGPTTLAIAVSFSGNTEETIEAATAAHDAGASLVAVTTGGRLADLARQWDAPLYVVDASIPMPRAAVGAITVAPLVALERIGLLSGVDAIVHRTAAQLRTRRDLDDVESDAVSDVISQIGAGHLLPIFYGGGSLGSVAASRAKAQVNENAKIPAYASAMPELCHNELAGWDLAGPPEQVSPLVVFALRHDFEHPQIARRYDFARRVLGEARIPVPYHEVRAQGDGPMAQLFDLIFQVDRLSLRMAAAAGRDPGPVALLTELKAYLAQS